MPGKDWDLCRVLELPKTLFIKKSVATPPCDITTNERVCIIQKTTSWFVVRSEKLTTCIFAGSGHFVELFMKN